MIEDDIHLGSFKQGEIPLALSVRFDDYTGTQIDISTGFSAIAYQIRRGADPSEAQELTATIDSGTNPLGLVVVEFTADSTADLGAFQVEAWIGDGTNLLASRTYRFAVTSRIPVSAPTLP